MSSSLCNEPAFWGRVQRHLDHRRDPLEDSEVEQFLLEYPALLVPFAELQHSLRILAPATPGSGGQAAKRRSRLIAAALFLALVSLWFLPDVGSPAPMPDLVEDTRVLAWDVRVVTTSPGMRKELRFERGNLTDQTIETVTFQPAGSDSLQVVSLQVSKIRTSSQ